MIFVEMEKKTDAGSHGDSWKSYFNKLLNKNGLGFVLLLVASVMVLDLRLSTIKIQWTQKNVTNHVLHALACIVEACALHPPSQLLLLR